MDDQASRTYFERRAEQERFAAEHAANERSARPHREMADRYCKLAIDGETTPGEPTGPPNGSMDFRLLP